jgi:MoaA/NifB/PqqE/SkfB family radical SAM enzyme
MQKQTVYNQYKLLKHLDSLMQWKETGNTIPHAVDLNLTNRCNNKCPLCFDPGKNERDNTEMEYRLVKDIIKQLGDVGVKGIVLGGGGDPACHPNLAEIIRFIKQSGIDTAISTNGYQMSDDIIDAIASCCTFVRISLDADSPEIYKKTHGLDAAAFNNVIGNIKKLIAARERLSSSPVIEVCYLIGPHTIKGVYNAAKMVKELGVDSIRIRPFYNWGNMKKPKENELQYILAELEKCNQLADKKFSVSVTTNRFELLSEKKSGHNYKECNVHNFYTVVAPDAKVYPCYVHKNKKEFCFGDLSQNSFKEIWASKQRKQALKRIKIKECQNHCRFEKTNEFLYGVKTNQLVGDMNLCDMYCSMRDSIPHPNFM